MDLEFLLNQVKKAIFNDPSTPQRDGEDPTGLIGQIEGLFRQGMGGGQEADPQHSPYGDVRPASEDPLGDPADLDPGGYMPASSEREYVDPRFGNVKPASEDPLGDPADQEGFPASQQSPYKDPRFPNLKPLELPPRPRRT